VEILFSVRECRTSQPTPIRQVSAQQDDIRIPPSPQN